MRSQRTFRVSVAIAIIAMAGLVLSAWWLGKQADALVNATSAAQTTKEALTEEQARLQKTAEELSQSTQQAKEQATALQESIEDSERYQRDQLQRANRSRELSNALAAASSVKVAMAEHFMTMGKWPSSNEDAGASAPESYKADTLQRVAVERDGKIQLVFENGGSKATLWLLASVNAASQISWRCISPDIVDITQLVPGCAYRPSL